MLNYLRNVEMSCSFKTLGFHQINSSLGFIELTIQKEITISPYVSLSTMTRIREMVVSKLIRKTSRKSPGKLIIYPSVFGEHINRSLLSLASLKMKDKLGEELHGGAAGMASV